MSNPAYPLELFQRVITVSLETLIIVRGLPKLGIAGSSEKSKSSEEASIVAMKKGILAQWGETDAAKISLRIIDGISSMNMSDTPKISFGDIIHMLGISEIDRNVISALAILVKSEFAILHAGGKLIGDDKTQYDLTSEEFQQVLKIGTLVHPITGEPVQNAAQKVVPVFELTSDLSSGDPE